MKKYDKKPKIIKNCIQCKKDFFVYPCREKDAQFCSKSCAYDFKGRVKLKNCIICDKEFRPSNYNKDGCGKFCSQECFGLSRKGKMPWNKGIKASEDERIKRFSDAGRTALIGHIPWNKGVESGKSNWIRKNGTHEYRNLHKRIERKFGKPYFCEICKTTDNNIIYHWANKTNLYLEVREDWLRLCPKCHVKYDRNINHN